MAPSSRSEGMGRNRFTPPIASAKRSGLASTNLRAVTDGMARLSIRMALRTSWASISSSNSAMSTGSNIDCGPLK